jgi:hypothetical protein
MHVAVLKLLYKPEYLIDTILGRSENFSMNLIIIATLAEEVEEGSSTGTGLG